jgi:anti-sigma regulatory factor (Ser/Thr protein kinase)
MQGSAGERNGALTAVRLVVPALPANVALVRQALAGLTEELGVEAARAADMKIALTEACTNVVVHAYGDDPGPLEVAMDVEHGRLVLGVRDRGSGLHPLPGRDEGAPLGFGLALIASLSDELGLVGGRHGTEVRIAFALSSSDAPPLAIQPSADPAPVADDIVLELRPPERTSPVLGRVVSLVAARADFSIDRLSDAQIVSDAIAGAAATHLADGTLSVAIAEHERGFDLLVGSFAAGGARRLVEDTELPGLGSLLERLTDTIAVEQTGIPDDERLRIRLLARD